MIGLDTNLLIRYLTQDDPEQSRKATREIEKGVSTGYMFFISNIVMCELVWVLETAYGYSCVEIIPVLENILRIKQFQFESKDLLWRSLSDYRSHRGDFADHLIGQIGRQAGCLETLTFDTGLNRSPIFRIL